VEFLTHKVRPTFYEEHYKKVFLKDPTPWQPLDEHPLIGGFPASTDPPPQFEGIRRLPPATGHSYRAPSPPPLVSWDLLDNFEPAERYWVEIPHPERDHIVV